MILYISSIVMLVESSAIAESSCILSGGDGETKDQCLAKSDLLGSLDLAAPTNPLFILMGTTPESVITPKAGDDFMLSLLPRAVDAFGNDNFAIALEINPGLVMLPSRIAVADLGFFEDKPVYGKSLSTARLLSRFTTTLVANRKTGDTDSTQYGFGLSFNHDTKNPLINNGDYRDCISLNQSELDTASGVSQKKLTALDKALIDFGVQGGDLEEKRRKVKQKLVSIKTINAKEIFAVLKAEGVSVDRSGSTKNIIFIEEVEAALQTLDEKVAQLHSTITGCTNELSKWNRDVYAGGLAVYRTDTTGASGSTSDFDDVGDATGFGAWVSLAFDSSIADSEGQFIVHARYNEDLVRERGSGDDAVVERVDAWSLGGRYTHELSTSSKKSGFNLGAVRGFIETAYTNEEFGSITDEFWQAGIGAEFQVRKDLFFQFIIGDTFDSEIDRSTYLSGQFKWSLSKSPAQ
jgi:hypothetical protein